MDCFPYQCNSWAYWKIVSVSLFLTFRRFGVRDSTLSVIITNISWLMIFNVSILCVKSHTPLKLHGLRIRWKTGEYSEKNKNDKMVAKLQKHLIWRQEAESVWKIHFKEYNKSGGYWLRISHRATEREHNRGMSTGDQGYVFVKRMVEAQRQWLIKWYSARWTYGHKDCPTSVSGSHHYCGRSFLLGVWLPCAGSTWVPICWPGIFA